MATRFPGRPQLEAGAASANEWLMSSALTSFILARQAGLKADFPREYGDWETRPMLFMPSPITSTSDPFLAHVHSDFYEKARKYVEKGGFLYASLACRWRCAGNDLVVWRTHCGSRHFHGSHNKNDGALREFESRETRCTTSVPSASLQSWGVLLEVSTGKVIAVDQDGHPALVINSLGAGKTLLSAYPIEHYLAGVPGAFDQPENTRKLYEAFREWTGVKPPFRSDRPEVEVSSLKGDHRGYLVVVNHSDHPQDSAILSSAVRCTSYSSITPDGANPLPLETAQTQRVHLDPYEAAILEWKQ